MFRQHAGHDVLVDVDPERLRDDQRDPWTAEPRIARLEFDDRLDQRLAGPFGPGFWGAGVDENSWRYLRRTNA